MRPTARLLPILALFTLTFARSAAGAGQPMEFVGGLDAISGDYSSAVVDTDRHVAYQANGFIGTGVLVIDIHDRENPVLARILPMPPPNDLQNKTAPFDVDLVGRYLLVSYHPEFGLSAFKGVSVYDISADPYNPTHLRDIPFSGCGVESSQLDPEVESGRPYAYSNVHCIFDPSVVITNILTGAILATYVGPEPYGCPPFPCVEENAPHEAMVQRHPQSGRVLDYVGYWDSGLRILDVTDPANPVEVGAFDYGPNTGFRNAHGAVVTPSGDWVYVGDEIGAGGTGGIHVFDTSACDGTSHCTPVQVGFWHVDGHIVQDGAPRRGNDGGRSFAFDVHNMDPIGENALLTANYSLGIRLLDTTDKTDPEEISFFLTNNYDGGDGSPSTFLVGRRTYSAVQGGDGLIYASDMLTGFFIVALNPQTVLPAASFARNGTRIGREVENVRISAGQDGHRFSFSLRNGGPSSVTVFDVSGRRVGRIEGTGVANGVTTLVWSARTEDGSSAPRGIYFARIATPDGEKSLKFLRLAP